MKQLPNNNFQQNKIDDEEPELPFEIRIMRCVDQHQWYYNSLYEKFEVVAINDQEQTYTVAAYNGYGKEVFDEVNISDCKIIEL